MNTNKKTAIIVGVLYILGDVAGILSRVVTGPIRDAQDYLVHVSANANQVITGSLLLLTMGLALAMIPVMVFPILEKHNKPLALGYVVFRGGIETVTYIAVVISWLSLVSLSQAYVRAGAPNASNFQAVGNLLKAEAIDSITAIVFPLAALMFYYLLYRSKLIPRWIAGWGLIAAIPYLASGLFAMFALVEPFSPVEAVLRVPLGLQELFLAVWLIVKGFNPFAIASGSAKVDVN